MVPRSHVTPLWPPAEKERWGGDDSSRQSLTCFFFVFFFLSSSFPMIIFVIIFAARTTGGPERSESHHRSSTFVTFPLDDIMMCLSDGLHATFHQPFLFYPFLFFFFNSVCVCVCVYSNTHTAGLYTIDILIHHQPVCCLCSDARNERGRSYKTKRWIIFHQVRMNRICKLPPPPRWIIALIITSQIHTHTHTWMICGVVVRTLKQLHVAIKACVPWRNHLHRTNTIQPFFDFYFPPSYNLTINNQKHQFPREQRKRNSQIIYGEKI